MSLFTEDEIDFTAISGNTADPSTQPTSSARRIFEGVAITALGGTILAIVNKYSTKQPQRSQVHISQEKLREAYHQAEAECPTPQKEE